MVWRLEFGYGFVGIYGFVADLKNETILGERGISLLAFSDLFDSPGFCLRNMIMKG